jgi:hypothetical protein
MRTAAGFTDALSFTHESTAQDRSYLEWEQEGLAQMCFTRSPGQ